MKIRLSELAQQGHYGWDEILALAKEKLSEDMITGVGKNTWISEEGQEILTEAIDVPEATPAHYKGQVIKVAPNKKYVYVYIREAGMKVPVLVPKKLAKKLVGKQILIEAIQDVSGTSYRYRRAAA
tara:strand:+ start:4095 stop:4472 length:378 start_codon:yes stop_codon:yes gene_type:complete